MKNNMKENFLLDLKYTEEILVNFLREEVYKVGFNKVILGLSGGIDSALVAFLAVKAFGKENVNVVMMPYKTSSKESLLHAQLVIDALGINSKKVEITDMIEPYFEKNLDMTSLRKGNMMARIRMNVLFDNSAKEKALVLGTSNKTEILLGYSTQFGDSAAAINPIGDLYKEQVWALSEYLGVPKEIIDKKPSADLWEGQTDEEELGFSYKLADEILYNLVELGMKKNEIISLGYKEEIIDAIIKKIKMNHYKRKLPVIANISKRGIGNNFSYLRDFGV